MAPEICKPGVVGLIAAGAIVAATFTYFTSTAARKKRVENTGDDDCKSLFYVEKTGSNGSGMSEGMKPSDQEVAKMKVTSSFVINLLVFCCASVAPYPY